LHTKNRIITSFGSAFVSKDELLFNEIESLGKVIAQKGWTVCSGGYYGSMEAISKGAKSAGGKTIGVTVKEWTAKINQYIDEEVKMRSLMERIVELVGVADAYIIFKGGTGTLVEISVALELMNKKIMGEKPLIFYTKFWSNMIEILKQDSDKLKELIEKNVKFIANPKELSPLLN
jgi:uncharacterized protein (TIGR00730 family)